MNYQVIAVKELGATQWDVHLKSKSVMREYPREDVPGRSRPNQRRCRGHWIAEIIIGRVWEEGGGITVRNGNVIAARIASHICNVMQRHHYHVHYRFIPEGEEIIEPAWPFTAEECALQTHLLKHAD